MRLPRIFDGGYSVPSREYPDQAVDPDTYTITNSFSRHTLRLSPFTPLYPYCLLIVREFRENVGEQPEQTCLIIVADFQGKLITAFPATPAQAGLGRPAEVG